VKFSNEIREANFAFLTEKLWNIYYQNIVLFVSNSPIFKVKVSNVIQQKSFHLKRFFDQFDLHKFTAVL